MDDDGIAVPRAELTARLDGLGDAADALREIGLPQRAGEIERRIATLRWRLRVSAEVTLVVIAGGTGVGKSSLLNALAGEEVSPAGVRRPTTTRPVAWVPAAAPGDLTELLRDIGITDQVPQERLPGIAVVDLPDIDSEERAHRAIATAVIARADQIVWVVDPEKYGDAALHEDLLGDAHDPQPVFVLNQVDRLTPEEIEAVTADLELRLRDRDGDTVPDILPVAADPAEGPATGIEELITVLRERARPAASRAREQIRREVEVTAASVAAMLGGDDPDPGSLRARYGGAREVACTHIRDAVIRPEGTAMAVRAWQAAALRVTTPSVAYRDPAAALLRDDPDAGPHLEEAALALSRVVDDLAHRPLAAPLRRRHDPDELHSATSRAATRAREVAAAVMAAPAPAWWRTLGWIHAGAVAAAVLSLVWAATGIGGQPQGVGASIIVLAASVVAALGLTGVLLIAGRREGARRAGRAEADVRDEAGAVLDRGLGQDVARLEDLAAAVRVALGDAGGGSATGHPDHHEGDGADRMWPTVPRGSLRRHA